MTSLLPMLLFAGPLLAQTSTSTYSQTVHVSRSEQQVEIHSTRIVGRVGGGPNVYDKTFNLPLGAPEVQATLAGAKTQMKSTEALTFQDTVNTLTDVSSRVITEQTNAIRTIGRTRRETMGPATINVGALGSEASPCVGYTGGLPLTNGGLSPDDGFLFKFTMPLVPNGCPIEGTPFAVPAGVLNVDTLIHIHTDVYQTSTTVRTTRSSSTYELIGTPVPAASPDAPSLLVRYVRNIDRGDSLIYLTNSGARGAGLAAGNTANTTGAICANVYAFSPDNELVSCCSCPVTPTGLKCLSARRDLLISPANSAPLVVKLYATTPKNGSCNGSAADNFANGAAGLHAWGTSIQIGAAGKPDPVTDGQFLPATIGPGERERLASRCAMLYANGSGFGICSSCRTGSGNFASSSCP